MSSLTLSVYINCTTHCLNIGTKLLNVRDANKFCNVPHVFYKHSGMELITRRVNSQGQRKTHDELDATRSIIRLIIMILFLLYIYQNVIEDHNNYSRRCRY